MAADWTTIAEGFVAGGFPWVSQLKALPIHFEKDGLDLSAIFNFFASLFAVAVYSFTIYAHPTQVVGLPHWYWWLLVAFALCVAYFSFFLFRRDAVKSSGLKWPILVNFVLYIGIFVSLTGGFGVLKLLDPFVVTEGIVVDASGAGVDRAEVEVVDDRGYAVSTFTDPHGRFVLLIDKTKSEISKANVTAPGKPSEQTTFSGAFSAPNHLRRIQLH